MLYKKSSFHQKTSCEVENLTVSKVIDDDAGQTYNIYNFCSFEY